MSTMVNLMRRAMLCQNGKSQGSHSPMHLMANHFHNRATPKRGKRRRECMVWPYALPFRCFPGLCLADLAAAPSSLVVPHLAALAIGPGQRLRTTHQVAGEAAVRGMTS